ncbi:hypothetical protein GQX74_009802 [Glossina fuscipes]|nr:hypothetical protein GQX74_009802 [Glossina fuscipes]
MNLGSTAWVWAMPLLSYFLLEYLSFVHYLPQQRHALIFTAISCGSRISIVIKGMEMKSMINTRGQIRHSEAYGRKIHLALYAYRLEQITLSALSGFYMVGGGLFSFSTN